MISTLEPQQGALFVTSADKAAKDVQWLENLLAGAGTWMLASDILLSIGWPVNDANKRWVRQLASQSMEIISGQKGYLHTTAASAEEVNHSANWLISQGKEMIKRGLAQRKAAHAILG